MTHPSPTALEEMNAIAATDRDAAHVKTDGAVPSVVLAAVRACAASWVPDARLLGNVRAGDIVRAIAALEAELDKERKAANQWMGEAVRDHNDLMRAQGRIEDLLEEAQRATRLPDRDKLATWLHEWLSKNGVIAYLDHVPIETPDHLADAILALLSGAATPLDPEKMPEEIALLKEQVNEIEARVKPTIGPTFGSDGNGGIRETREGRIQSTDFYTLLGLATAGVLKHEAALKAADRVTGEAAPFTDAELDDAKISGFIPPRAFATIQALRKSGAATPAPTAALTEEEHSQVEDARYHAEKYPSEWWSEAILELTDIIDRIATKPAKSPPQGAEE